MFLSILFIGTNVMKTKTPCWTGRGILWDWIDEGNRVPWWFGWASSNPATFRNLVIVIPFNWIWAVGEWIYLAIRICRIVQKIKGLEREQKELIAELEFLSQKSKLMRERITKN